LSAVGLGIVEAVHSMEQIAGFGTLSVEDPTLEHSGMPVQTVALAAVALAAVALAAVALAAVALAVVVLVVVVYVRLSQAPDLDSGTLPP
jgi:hypothetical protein